MSEKIGGAKGTELDDEFTEMEKVSFVAVTLYFLCRNGKPCNAVLHSSVCK